MSTGPSPTAHARCHTQFGPLQPALAGKRYNSIQNVNIANRLFSSTATVVPVAPVSSSAAWSPAAYSPTTPALGTVSSPINHSYQIHTNQTTVHRCRIRQQDLRCSRRYGRCRCHPVVKWTYPHSDSRGNWEVENAGLKSSSILLLIRALAWTGTSRLTTKSVLASNFSMTLCGNSTVYLRHEPFVFVWIEKRKMSMMEPVLMIVSQYLASSCEFCVPSLST